MIHKPLNKYYFNMNISAETKVLTMIHDYDFSLENYALQISNEFTKCYIYFSDTFAIYKWAFASNLKVFELPRSRFLSKLLNLLNIIFILSTFTIFLIVKYKPNIVIVNTNILPIILKPFALVYSIKVVYISSDWFYVKEINSLKNLVLNKYVFNILDYFCCKSSYLILNYSNRITLQRCEFWGRQINVNQKLYPIFLSEKIKKVSTNRKTIAFFGNIRNDSGLELILEILGELSLTIDGLTLVVVGAVNDHALQLSQHYGYLIKSGQLIFKGYLHRSQFSDILSSCFLGLNLINSQFNYTQFTIPGKIFDYLQHGVPPLISLNVGEICNTVKLHELGLITDLSRDDLKQKVLTLYENQSFFIDNIHLYIHSSRNFSFKDLLE